MRLCHESSREACGSGLRGVRVRVRGRGRDRVRVRGRVRARVRVSRAPALTPSRLAGPNPLLLLGSDACGERGHVARDCPRLLEKLLQQQARLRLRTRVRVRGRVLILTLGLTLTIT